MKKLISFAMAVVLCLGMSTTVFAAPSAEYNSPVVDNSGNSANSGSIANPIKPTVQNGHTLNDAQAATLEAYGSVENMFTGKAGVAVDANRVTELDLEADIPEGGAWVKIMKWSDIKWEDGDNTVVVLHMNDAGELEEIHWEVIVEDGEYILVGLFTSLSPVWVAPTTVTVSSWYYDPAIDGPVNPSLAGAGVSPKTADNSISLYVMMLAVAACGTMVVKTRKAR